jgi:hypothetical protein
VETVLLRRLYVLVYMELASRRIVWFAVTDRPDAIWVGQQARNTVWELSERGAAARFLIHDHDAMLIWKGRSSQRGASASTGCRSLVGGIWRG